jgi:hypothetical protein
MYPQPPRRPSIAGAIGPLAIKPWMLVVGALLMAILAFAITRVLLS